MRNGGSEGDWKIPESGSIVSDNRGGDARKVSNYIYILEGPVF